MCDMMKMMRSCVLLFSLLQALFLSATSDSGLADRFVKMGFENVKVGETGGVVYAAFEDPTNRGTYRGLGIMLEQLSQYYLDAERFEVVVLDSKIPKVCVHATHAGGQWSQHVDYEVDRAMEVLKTVDERGSSLGKIDVTFYPKVSVDNHRLDVLYEYAVAIAPSVETTLWRGNRITVQPVVPLIGGNLYDNNTLKYLRIGIADIEQEFMKGGCWSLKAAAGIIYSNFAGVHAEAGYQVSDALGLKLRIGLLGEAYVDKAGYHFETPDKFTFLAKADYYERLSRLQIQLTAGRFGYGDYGGRMDVTRHFGDYAIGVYGVLTGGEHNAGFHFAIPMMGKKQKRNGKIRLRLPEYFNWEYSMVSHFRYASDNMGREYTTRADENRSARYFQAEYIEQNLQRFLDGIVK